MSAAHRRRAVPTILQQEAVECGAACLAMVLAHHGRWIALEELRELCDVGRDGTKASNVIKVARRLGLVAKGLKRDLDELAAVPTPFIAFWNFNHFVVVEGVSLAGPRGRAWINDPASGPRTVARDEFDTAFTGVVLAFQPGPAFRRDGRRDRLGAILARRTAGYRLPMAAALAAGLLLLVPSIVAAGFGRIFIDSVLIGGHVDWLGPLLTAMAAVALLRGGLSYLQSSTLVRTQTAMATAMSARQMWRVLHLPLGFFSQRYAGDIANRFAIVDQVAGLVTGGLAPAAIGLASIVGYGAVLFLLDPVLGAVSAAAAAAALATLWLSARGLENAGRRSVSDASKLQAMTIGGIALAEDVRASGTESRLLSRWRGAQARVIDADQAGQLRTASLSFASSLAVALGGVGVLAVGGFRVMDGAISIGVLLAFQMLEAGFLGPALTLVGVGGQIQQLRGLGERLDDVDRYRTAAVERPSAAPAVAAEAAALRLRDVSFGYQQLEEPFIQGLDLAVAPAARVALVGGSGSGKSTVGRMMVGLLAPTGGTVEAAGTPLDGWPEAELRRRIAYVDQNVSLLEGTVRENITLWDDTMPEERVVAAARDAGAHGFITARPGAYGARLAEGGGNLSGGERQRLAIARALAVDPAVLVLDEATSALDSGTEAAVMDAVRRKGCACVIIAHRLSTIRDCDLIVVLRSGAIAEMGTHAELMALGGEYRHLVEH